MLSKDIQIILSVIINAFNSLDVYYQILLGINVLGVVATIVQQIVSSSIKNESLFEEDIIDDIPYKPIYLNSKNKKKSVNFGRRSMGDISASVECTFECSPHGTDAMYMIRFIRNGEVTLLSKKHSDFGKLYKSLKQTHPFVSEMKSLIVTTGSLLVMNKKLKWAKFDPFLEAVVQFDQPWPSSLYKFFDVDTSTLGDLSVITYQEEKKEDIKDCPTLKKLNVSERAILDKLVLRVNVVGIKKHLWYEDTVHRHCLRILQARKFDLEPAVDQIANDLNWRNINNWKLKVINEIDPLKNLLGMSYDLMSQYLPVWHQGYDKMNRPISIQQMGQLRLPVLIANTTLDKVLDFLAYHTEYMISKCGERGVDGFVVIIDAFNFDAKNIFYSDALKMVKQMNEINRYHNPDRLGKMYIINAPSVLHTFYGMVSYLLDEVTAKKIQLFSTKEHWAPILAQDIDLDQLPPEYGGTGVNNLRNEYPIIEQEEEKEEEDDDEDEDDEDDEDVTEIEL